MTASTLMLIIVKRTTQPSLGTSTCAATDPKSHLSTACMLKSNVFPSTMLDACSTPFLSSLGMKKKQQTRPNVATVFKHTFITYSSLFLLQGTFLCHNLLIAPSFKTNSSLMSFPIPPLPSCPAVLPELSLWLSTPPKHHKGANITATPVSFSRVPCRHHVL